MLLKRGPSQICRMSSDSGRTSASSSGARARAESMPDDESLVSSFVASMPAVYRDRFAPEAVREHAQIVLERGDATAHAALWQELPGGAAGICVVADDRPGLLSLISIALTQHELDVSAAQIYGRSLPGGSVEAVDLFWVTLLDARGGQHPGAPDRMEISAMGGTLASLIERTRARPHDAPAPHPTDRRVPGGGARRARFAYEAETSGCVLIVEAADRPGLLLTVARTLFELGTQIVRSDVITIRGRAVDRFHVTEIDGGALSPSRCSQIERAIDHVLEQPFRRAAYAASSNGSRSR